MEVLEKGKQPDQEIQKWQMFAQWTIQIGYMEVEMQKLLSLSIQIQNVLSVQEFTQH
jgi:hypothetical protein